MAITGRVSGPSIEKLETVYKRWASMSVAHIRLPDGSLVSRDVEDHGAAVAVLPYDATRKTVILVEQLRAAPLVAAGQQHTLEAIAGCIEQEGEETTARREAMEEAGLRIDALERIASVWSMPGVSTERLTLYLAPYSAEDRIGDGGGVADEQENIRVVEMSFTALADLMAAGQLVDMKTLVLAQALQLRRPDLFD